MDGILVGCCFFLSDVASVEKLVEPGEPAVVADDLFIGAARLGTVEAGSLRCRRERNANTEDNDEVQDGFHDRPL
jgi:hypothetical protein